MATEKRLIYADELVDAICRSDELLHSTQWETDEIVDQIDKIPTVDAVEVVHGRWEDIFGGKYANPRYRCSVCKEKALYKFKTNELYQWYETQGLTHYCPNCGADMRERKDNGRTEE